MINKACLLAGLAKEGGRRGFLTVQLVGSTYLKSLVRRRLALPCPSNSSSLSM